MNPATLSRAPGVAASTTHRCTCTIECTAVETIAIDLEACDWLARRQALRY